MLWLNFQAVSTHPGSSVGLTLFCDESSCSYNVKKSKTTAHVATTLRKALQLQDSLPGDSPPQKKKILRVSSAREKIRPICQERMR